MFGYACRETPELMPAPIYYAHKILKLLSEARRAGRDRRRSAPTPRARSPSATRTASRSRRRRSCVSTQHLDEQLSSHDIRAIVEPYVRKALPDGWITKQTVWHVNPTGKFVIGGPDGDCGLTGRKIIVDTYGGAAPHGGGAFSGKDPTKVDRSAAYAARYLAKNVVAAGLAERCTIQLSYAIGVAKPLSIYVDLHGTGKVDEAKLEKTLSRGDGPLAARHPRASRAQPADLRPHLRLRPFRPRAGGGRRLLVGKDRPRRRAQERARLEPCTRPLVPAQAGARASTAAGVRIRRLRVGNARMRDRMSTREDRQRIAPAPSSAGARAMRCARIRPG